MGFKCPKQYLLLLLWLLLNSVKVNCDSDGGVCPRYCKCYMWNGMRRADCINQKLINIEIGVPKNVQALVLSNNSISALGNGGFQELGYVHLKYLNFQFNKISSIGMHAFAGLKDLQMVDLSNNYLHYLLPTTFHDTPALRSLHLAHNKLGRTNAGPLIIMPSLIELDISYCQLGMLHEDFFSKLPSLRKLNISNNQLIRINQQTLQPLEFLVDVDLSNNPWSCDGTMMEFQLWLQTQRITDTSNCAKQEEKFAKIIITAVNKTEIESMEDISIFWFDTDEKENRDDEVFKTVLTNTTMTPVEKFYNYMQRIPSMWAMLMGFLVGVGITMVVMYVWLRMCNCKRKETMLVRARRVRTNQLLWRELQSSEEPMCPGTPPPPYHTYTATTNFF